MNFSNRYLWVEFICLTLLIPTLLFAFKATNFAFACLFAVTVYACYRLRHYLSANFKNLWSHSIIQWSVLSPIMQRFLLLAAAMTAFTLYYHSDRFLQFMSNAPATWAMVMLLYPFLSVIPQEIVYRTFLFERYKEIFPDPFMMISASAISFGYVHIIFHNLVAFTFSVIGGFLFAYTYHRHRSLLLVSVEHALYGCFIFTVGLGWYFYHGAVDLQLQ